MPKPLTDTERRAWLALDHVGPATVGDLELLGVRRLSQLARRSPQGLFDALCRRTGTRQDPCVLDVFTMLTSLARGEPARPWWEFSRERISRAGGPPSGPARGARTRAPKPLAGGGARKGRVRRSGVSGRPGARA
ncbi:MAG: mitomycin resistance protein [Planctomycetes bacterium]|nr:mitomycin resistance protein [Planctomycetota bacterium]